MIVVGVVSLALVPKKNPKNIQFLPFDQLHWQRSLCCCCEYNFPAARLELKTTSSRRPRLAAVTCDEWLLSSGCCRWTSSVKPPWLAQFSKNCNPVVTRLACGRVQNLFFFSFFFFLFYSYSSSFLPPSLHGNPQVSLHAPWGDDLSALLTSIQEEEVEAGAEDEGEGGKGCD